MPAWTPSSATSIACDTVAVAPRSSVTVNVTVFGPGAAYLCVGSRLVEVAGVNVKAANAGPVPPTPPPPPPAQEQLVGAATALAVNAIRSATASGIAAAARRVRIRARVVDMGMPPGCRGVRGAMASHCSRATLELCWGYLGPTRGDSGAPLRTTHGRVGRSARGGGPARAPGPSIVRLPGPRATPAGPARRGDMGGLGPAWAPRGGVRGVRAALPTRPAAARG